jgi:DsbC/DsbD-like thiol-disulfide interchange protein
MTAIDRWTKASFRSSRYDDVMRSTALTILVAGILSAPAVPLPGESAALAAQSEWDIGDFHRSRLLLVAGEGTELRGGLEIAMEEGWHTYWRVPGDAGIPPQLDFSASSNLADVTVSYPIPVRYHDGSALSLVYWGHVTLPLSVEPVDPDLPVTLTVNARFGVCDVICIPAKTTMSVTLMPQSGDDPRARVAIEQAQRKLPGSPQTGRFDVESATRKEGNLEIAVRIPDANFIDLFAEGPQDWFLGQPQLISRQGAIARYRLPLEGMPEGETVSGRTSGALQRLPDARHRAARRACPNEPV